MRLVILALSVATLASSIGPLPAAAQKLPEIRLGERNRVPACVTPQRLMAFLTERNPRLQARFQNIAAYYKTHGEHHRVRWDYAFFQMIIETNYLLFRNAAGKGDVNPDQNNFAGIGTTGGGVPGDRFPDVSTGVLGQIQHLIAYSGEFVENPVAPRTREKQEHIVALSQRLKRPVTFRDLAGRWAVDRRYGRSIAFIADRFAARYCTGRDPDPEPEALRPAAEVVAARRGPDRQLTALASASGLGNPAVRPPPGLVSPPTAAVRPRLACKVFTASYGGERNVLIRRRVGDELHYTALAVIAGQESRLADAFIRTHAAGGEAIAEYSSRDEALTGAFNRCPAGATATAGNRN
jgi:hypothetical protein